MSCELSICAVSVLCHSKFGCEYIQPQTVEDRSIMVETISLVLAVRRREREERESERGERERRERERREREH